MSADQHDSRTLLFALACIAFAYACENAQYYAFNVAIPGADTHTGNSMGLIGESMMMPGNFIAFTLLALCFCKFAHEQLSGAVIVNIAIAVLCMCVVLDTSMRQIVFKQSHAVVCNTTRHPLIVDSSKAIWMNRENTFPVGRSHPVRSCKDLYQDRCNIPAVVAGSCWFHTTKVSGSVEGSFLLLCNVKTVYVQYLRQSMAATWVHEYVSIQFLSLAPFWACTLLPLTLVVSMLKQAKVVADFLSNKIVMTAGIAVQCLAAGTFLLMLLPVVSYSVAVLMGPVTCLGYGWVAAPAMFCTRLVCSVVHGYTVSVLLKLPAELAIWAHTSLSGHLERYLGDNADRVMCMAGQLLRTLVFIQLYLLFGGPTGKLPFLDPICFLFADVWFEPLSRELVFETAVLLLQALSNKFIDVLGMMIKDLKAEHAKSKKVKVSQTHQSGPSNVERVRGGGQGVTPGAAASQSIPSASHGSYTAPVPPASVAATGSRLQDLAGSQISPSRNGPRDVVLTTPVRQTAHQGSTNTTNPRNKRKSPEQDANNTSANKRNRRNLGKGSTAAAPPPATRNRGGSARVLAGTNSVPPPTTWAAAISRAAAIVSSF